MSFVMSLVQTIARLGFAPNLASAWLTSFAIGAAVAMAKEILVAPSARRLAWPGPLCSSLVFGQDRLQMPLTEDEHPVGDLGPGGEHEPFRVSVRALAAGRDLHCFHAGVSQDCIKTTR